MMRTSKKQKMHENNFSILKRVSQTNWRTGIPKSVVPCHIYFVPKSIKSKISPQIILNQSSYIYRKFAFINLLRK